jgi:5-methylcytosine-specific restriction protein B
MTFVEPSTSITADWQAKGGKAVLELLAERGKPTHYSEIAAVLRERLHPEGDALEVMSNGAERWFNLIAWGATDQRAAGWLEKSGTGMWSITDAGRQALVDHPDAFELRQIANRIYREKLPPLPTRRAWLVRGASVRGENIVPTWLADGFVSVAATRLESLAEGDELRAAAERAYEHLPYSERTEKVNELVSFVQKVSEGDLVVTTIGGELFIGDVTGNAEFTLSEDGRSNLRRSVLWRNAESPLDYADLPATVAAKFQGGGTLVELTGQMADLEAMLVDVEGGGGRPVNKPPLGHHKELAQLPPGSVADLYVTDEWANLLVDLLNERKQLILYGPPGTGKTYLARKLAARLAGAEQVRLIQFHPAYTYEDFFEGYRPAGNSEAGTLTFEIRQGPFRRIVREAVDHPDQAFILIIDEINRANLAKVFGELYFLLEYRDQPVEPLYSDEVFTLPPNVYLVGTMNTADRSIALLDSAMRRRFAFVALNPAEEPTRSVLRKWLADHHQPDTAARFLDAVNARIDDVDAKIGPSYFIHDDQSRERIERVWNTSLLPLLREHFYGEWAQREAAFRFETLWTEATGGDAGA